MALPTNADVIVVHGYWLDELTGLGVKQANGLPATIMFDPVPLLGANATKTPNLRDLTSNAHLKTRTRVASVDPVTGYYAAQLVASNDPDLDAYSGRRVTFLGEDPFTIEVPYNAPTVTVSAEMAAKTGLTQGSSVKAIWLPNASVTTIPTPTPPNNYLTSTQTLANIASGIETHDEDPAAHADIRAAISASIAGVPEAARDALGAALVAGSNVTITPNDGADTITISVTVPASYSDEQAQDAFAALIAAGTHSGISFAYNDAGNALSATVAAQSWSQITGKPTFAAVATSGSASDITTGTLPDGVIPSGIARDTEVATAVANLVNSAPGTLDTLGEIATALQADESAAAALATTVASKASQSSVDTLAATIPPGWTQSATKTANYTAAAYEIVVIDTSGGTFTVTGPTNGKPFGFRWKAGTTAPTIAAPSGYTISGAASVTPGLAPSTSSGELVLWQAFSGDYQPIGGLKPQSALNAANDGRYVSKGTLAINVKDYGALGTNVVADKTGIDAAIAYAVSSGIRNIYFPAGTYRYDGVLAISARGLRFIGDRHGRPVESGGSRIQFYTGSSGGSGIQIGTDDGQAYGNADYSGLQGFTLQDMSLAAINNGAGTTTLLNSLASYVPGSYGVRDWKGGDVRLIRTTMENFEYGFWGVNSDLDRWESTEFFYCKVGAYLGPRSDQFVSRASYFLYNNQDVVIDGSRLVTFYDFVSNSSGFTTTCPVQIVGGYGLGSDAVTFIAPWLEHTQVNGSVDAWFDIGPSDSDTQVGEVVILDPYYGHNRTTDTPPTHEKYLAKVGNAKSLSIRNPMGALGAPNTDFTVAFVGTTSPEVFLEAAGTWWNYLPKTTNLGTGTPRFSFHRLTGYTATNQNPGQQAMSHLIVQKTDTASGSGLSPFEVHRDQTGTQSFQVNNSGNTITRGGLFVNGRGLSSSVLNGLGSYTATWDPGTVTAGAIATTTVAASGAVVGDPVAVGFTKNTVAGVLITASVTASGTVTATAHNMTGASWAPGSGTVRVTVFGY